MTCMTIGRETVRSSNAATVLRTLVPQARAIFKLLAEHQMEDRDEGEEEGQSSLTTFLTHRIAWDHPARVESRACFLKQSCVHFQPL